MHFKTLLSGTPGPCCDEYWRKPFSDRKPLLARQSRGLGAWVRCFNQIKAFLVLTCSRPEWWLERTLSALRMTVREIGRKKGFGSQCTSGEQFTNTHQWRQFSAWNLASSSYQSFNHKLDPNQIYPDISIPTTFTLLHFPSIQWKMADECALSANLFWWESQIMSFFAVNWMLVKEP